MADAQVTNRILSRARIVGYDFGTILDDLRANTASLFGAQFNEFLGDPASVLFDTIAYAQDALFYYLDRRTAEGFIETALQRNSVAMLTRLVGYKMRSAIPASVDLRFELSEVYPFPVTVPRGYQLKTSAGVIFEVSEEQVFNPGDGPKLIPAYQGETVSERFVSDGTALQRFRLRRFPSGTYPAAGNVRVLVDGVPWVESEFLTFDPTNQFETRFNLNPPELLFGDGAVGNIPAPGAEIVATYIACLGKAGGVGVGLINEQVRPLVANFTNISFTVTNPAKASAGDDPESLAQAKAFAGQVFKSRKVAVTESDYNALAGSFADPTAGRVAVARALSAKTPTSDATLESALAVIQALSTDYRPSVLEDLTAARAKLTEIQAQIDAQLAALTSAAALNTTSNSTLTATISVARGVKNKAGEIDVDASDIKGLVVDGNLLLESIPEEASDQLTGTTRAALKGYFDNINEQAIQVSTAATSVRSSADNIVSAVAAVQANLGSVGLDLTTAPSHLQATETSRQVIQTQVGDEDTPSGLWLDLSEIDTVVEDTASGTAEQVDKIRTHVAKFLASDCKANLISVLILARDEGGFYTAPSGALIRAVQLYLDARKALEQVVEVESGAIFLVPAVITVSAGVRPGTVAESVVRAGILVAIEAVLRDRAFGAPLFLDELYTAVRVVSGIRYINIKIEGSYDTLNNVDTSKLDLSGNLMVRDTEVVTRGLVSVTVTATTL